MKIRLKLQWRITLFVLAAVLSVFAVIIGATSFMNRKESVKLAEAYGALGIRVTKKEEVDAAIKLANGEKVEKIIDVPYQLITKENMAEFTNRNQK